MRKLYRSATAVLSAFLMIGTTPAVSAETGRTDISYRVVGYLPDWSYQYYTNIDFTALTHLDIAFCNPDENSQLSCNIPDDILQEIVNTAHAYNVKVMPSVATTVSSITFASLIDTPEEITKLNQNLIAYCQKFGFDGIDLDVERGSMDAVWNFYGDWVSALRTECDANGLALSTATAEWTAKRITPETFSLFDFVTVMAYADDSSTVSHTTLEFGQQQMNYIDNNWQPLNEYINIHFKDDGTISCDNPAVQIIPIGNGWSTIMISLDFIAAYADPEDASKSATGNETLTMVGFNGQFVNRSFFATKFQVNDAVNYGDLNCDGELNLNDIRELINILLSNIPPSQCIFDVIPDFDHNGRITAADLTCLKRMLLNYRNAA